MVLLTWQDDTTPCKRGQGEEDDVRTFVRDVRVFVGQIDIRDGPPPSALPFPRWPPVQEPARFLLCVQLVRYLWHRDRAHIFVLVPRALVFRWCLRQTCTASTTTTT
jgi:hypothetical protein